MNQAYLRGVLHFPSCITGPRNTFEQDYLALTKLPGLLSPHTGNIPSIPMTNFAASIHLLIKSFLAESQDDHRVSFLSTVVVECPQNVLAFPIVLKMFWLSQLSSHFPLILMELYSHTDVSPCCSRLTIGIVLTSMTSKSFLCTLIPPLQAL